MSDRKLGLDGRRTIERGGVLFAPLPLPERGHGSDGAGGNDDRCCCRYCSPNDRVSGDNPWGVWDTRATSLVTGESWLVHMPELHGREPKRGADE